MTSKSSSHLSWLVSVSYAWISGCPVLVQEHIDQGEADHIRGDVVSVDVFGEFFVFAGGEVVAVELSVGIDGVGGVFAVSAVSSKGELMFFRVKGGGIFAKDSAVGGD